MDNEVLKTTTMVRVRDGHGTINISLANLIRVSLKSYGDRLRQPIKVLGLDKLNSNVLAIYNRHDDRFEFIGDCDIAKLDDCNEHCYFVDLVPIARVVDQNLMDELGPTLLSFDE